MKTLATILTAFCVVFAGVQWWQVVYRVQLFYRDYGGERYANHVGDGVFTIIHIVNVALLLAGAFAVWAFWREPGVWRWGIVSVATANLIAWLTFSYMHTTGVLVGYDEFIRHMKGE